jgi:hypothetical protein
MSPWSCSAGCCVFEKQNGGKLTAAALPSSTSNSQSESSFSLSIHILHVSLSTQFIACVSVYRDLQPHMNAGGTC